MDKYNIDTKTININAELHMKIKLKCTELETSITKYVEEKLNKALEEDK